jgi:probable F420-dependent oxidoreductase
MERSYWASVFFGGGVDFPATVRTLEERGLAGLAVPQVYGPPFAPLAVAATVTKRIQLATGIAIGLTRSPFETAMAALDLDHPSQGRFVLGLGTGPMHWTKGYYGMPYDKPVSRLREVVQILRHVEDGARTGTMKPWQGDCYQLEFHGYEPTAPPYRERLPVWIAALRPRMCELAGEVADGLIGHPVWSVEWSLGQAQRSLAVGAARAGRDAANVHFQPWVTVSIDRDRKVAVNDAKPFVAFYAGFAQYHPYFEAHGFGPEARMLQAASNSMRPAEAARLVPDEMVRTFAACGTPDQVREWVEPLWQRANSMLILPPSWGLSPEELTAKAVAIAETFWAA